MMSGFHEGDWVELDLKDIPSQKHLLILNGLWGVVVEVLDPDNDLYRVEFDKDGSWVEANGNELKSSSAFEDERDVR
jgi:hypothetical protein